MVKHYFTCANTSKGFHNYFSSNLQGLDKVFILKGGPGTGKSTLMKKVGAKYNENNYEVEYIHCSSDVDSLDGVVIRKLGVAIVDGTAPHVIEPTAPGALEEYVHLGTAWDTERLKENKDTILSLQKEIFACYQTVYSTFADAARIHDEWEKYYIKEMNFEKAEEVTSHMIELLIGNHKCNKVGTSYHRFFGAVTPNGSVDFIENITENIKTRYFMKGRPGTGKSTMLKKISNVATEHGFNVEIYHCAFDPNSLDMVLIPELNVCIFDSTAPHEYFPSREGDIILDVYEQYINKGTDEKNEIALKEIEKHYKDLIQVAKSQLSKIKCLHDELEKYYIAATDFNEVNRIRKEIMEKIQRIEVSKMM